VCTFIIQVPALIIQPHRVVVSGFSVGWMGLASQNPELSVYIRHPGACVSTCNDEDGCCFFGLSAKPIQHCVFPLDLCNMVYTCIFYPSLN